MKSQFLQVTERKSAVCSMVLSSNDFVKEPQIELAWVETVKSK